MASDRSRIAVVEHQPSCPPALIGDWLRDAGCTLAMVRPYRGDSLGDLTTYDGVLVLGGDMGADEHHRAPWLPELKEQVRACVTAETPLWGVCLGHQVIASALGGRVHKNPLGQTVGLQPMGWTSTVEGDELFGPRVGGERCVHWNSDVVAVLPDGAALLATTPGGEPQVVRYAPRAWGVQAHPEVEVELLRSWAEDDRDDHVALGIDQEAVLAEIDAARAELERAWRPVAERFAAVTRQR